jgi:hypothetical protein
MLRSSAGNQLEGAMDEQRLTANEGLIDTLGARVDELERRLDALLKLLQQRPVQQLLNLKDIDFLHTAPTTSPMGMRTMKHCDARHRAVAQLRQDAVLKRLARVSPARLDELLRER